MTQKLEESLLSRQQLIEKAAGLKGLKVKKQDESTARSEALAEYVLDRKMLEHLAKHGMREQPRPDDIFTLCDENPQKERKGWAPSCYWNFRKSPQNDSTMKLQIIFTVEERLRGIVLMPEVCSGKNGVVSPCDQLPNFRMFQALVESMRQDVPPVARELAEKGRVVASWTELGLGGLRNLSELFREFSHGNKKLHELAEKFDIFSPTPMRRTGDLDAPRFMAEPAQPALFGAWENQLREYRESLKV